MKEWLIDWMNGWKNETKRNEMTSNKMKWNEMEWTEMQWNEKKRINMIESELKWMNAWMNEWMNEWMDGWMNEWLNEWDLPTLALSEDEVGKMDTRL